MTAVTQALLLTAGLGTRLRPLTMVRAKPAMPVGGEPMVRRIIRWLSTAGVSDVTLNLHHLPHTIAAVVGDGSDLGVRARYSWEQPVVLGSAGGPRRALDILDADRFLIVNGDTLADLQLGPLVADHAASGALVTLAVVPNVEPHRYSGLRADHRHQVLGVEPRGSTSPSHHFVGVQMVEREAFADLPAGQVLHSVGGTYQALITQRPGSVRVFPCDAAFWDIGTVADYWATCHAFGTADANTGAHVSGAKVTDCIVWDDVTVGEGAEVERCIVTDGVRIAPGSRYRDSILLRGQSDTPVTAALDVGEDG